MIKFRCSVICKQFLDNETLWKSWFSRLDMWVGQALPFERIAWLRVYGVPPHLWNRKVVDMIGAQFGPLVLPSQITLNDGNWTYDVIAVLRGDGGKISDKVTMRWRNQAFRCWVEEEQGEWVPDCVEGWDLSDQEGNSNLNIEDDTEKKTVEDAGVGGYNGEYNNVATVTAKMKEVSPAPGLEEGEIGPTVDGPSSSSGEGFPIDVVLHAGVDSHAHINEFRANLGNVGDCSQVGPGVTNEGSQENNVYWFTTQGEKNMGLPGVNGPNDDTGQLDVGGTLGAKGSIRPKRKKVFLPDLNETQNSDPFSLDKIIWLGDINKKSRKRKHKGPDSVFTKDSNKKTRQLSSIHSSVGAGTEAPVQEKICLDAKNQGGNRYNQSTR